jgi:hypothetical protein
MRQTSIQSITAKPVVSSAYRRSDDEAVIPVPRAGDEVSHVNSDAEGDQDEAQGYRGDDDQQANLVSGRNDFVRR